MSLYRQTIAEIRAFTVVGRRAYTYRISVSMQRWIVSISSYSTALTTYVRASPNTRAMQLPDGCKRSCAVRNQLSLDEGLSRLHESQECLPKPD